ncbi:MAG: hypothetical protein J6X60_06740 [Ruminiclostridium sp.]|nr:hypothetical protein [Ruminiclostridium sp.]
MTITIKSETINGYKICIEQEKYSTGYIVEDIPQINGDIYGYPISRNYYSTLEKARRRYNTLKRKYK